MQHQQPVQNLELITSENVFPLYLYDLHCVSETSPTLQIVT